MKYKLRYGRFTPEKFGWAEIIGCYPFYMVITATKPPEPVFSNGDGSFGFNFVPLRPELAAIYGPKFTVRYDHTPAGAIIWLIESNRREFKDESLGYGVSARYEVAQVEAERFIANLP